MPSTPLTDWVTPRLIAEHKRLDQLVDDVAGHVERMSTIEYDAYSANKRRRCDVMSEIMARVSRDPVARDYITGRTLASMELIAAE